MSELTEKIAAATAAETLILSPASPYESSEKYLQLRCSTPQGFTDLIYYRGDFHVWTGTHYRVMSEDWLRSDVYRFLDAAKQRKNGGDELIPFMPNSNKVNEVINALRARAIVDDHLSAPTWRPGGLGDLFCFATELLACRNGLLYLGSRSLLRHSPELLNFNALDFDYDPKASEPREWLKFLHSVWPNDPECIATLQEIFGYFVSGDTRQQKAFLIVGPKRGGKGTIARALTALLGGDNVAGPTLASLAEHFGLAPLIGKSAAIVSDARLSGRTDQHIIAERLLSISGEDRLTIDRKYRDPWAGRLSAPFLILSNELPRLADASGALASRFVLLMMQRSFYGQEDLNLANKLSQELPGILNWSLIGLDRLNCRGHFVSPKSSAEALHELEDLSSPIGAFIRECCVVAPDKTAYTEKMYSRWQLWCSANNRLSGTAQTFGRDLRAAVPGLTSERPRGGAEPERKRVYRGVGLSGSEMVRDGPRGGPT
jgi:putative DNA primase/helicase